MKTMLLTAILLLSANAKASESLSVVCSGVKTWPESNGDIVTVRVLIDKMRWDSGRMKMLVHLNSTPVFEKNITEKIDPNGIKVYTSKTFDNANDAPATLLLRIYPTEHGLIGSLQEQSYVPQIGFADLTCAQL